MEGGDGRGAGGCIMAERRIKHGRLGGCQAPRLHCPILTSLPNQRKGNPNITTPFNLSPSLYTHVS